MSAVLIGIGIVLLSLSFGAGLLLTMYGDRTGSDEPNSVEAILGFAGAAFILAGWMIGS